MPIPKERLFELVTASREILAALRLIREAVTSARRQLQEESITLPQYLQLESEAWDFNMPSPSAIATIQTEHAWQIKTAARNEYRKLWTQDRRAADRAALQLESMATRGLSRDEILAEFRRENGIPDPSTVTLETIGLEPPKGALHDDNASTCQEDDPA